MKTVFTLFLLFVQSAPTLRAAIVQDYIELSKNDLCYREIKGIVLGNQKINGTFKIESDAEFGRDYKVTVSSFFPFFVFQRISYGAFRFDAHSCKAQAPHKIESAIRSLASR